ncbi:MAG: carbohydrate ABC transporter permease [Eubacteriales bacterium]|nr:carbohydrate ABC transporter permease [Eubacteriales bacterium]
MTGMTLLLIVLAICVITYLFARNNPLVAKIALYLVLVLLSVVMIIPFYWMFVLATHETHVIYAFPPPFWFGAAIGDNYAFMSNAVNIYRHFGNSVLVTVVSTALVLLFCSMGGYAFATYRFPGQKVLFSILLGTMMVPALASVVPWFILISQLGWINHFEALIIPGCANAFGIFWMRQYCQNNVPVSLTEAAKIDGCSEWLIFFRVIAPILIPAFSALGIMQFVNTWNDYMVPMLVLRDTDMYTLPIMLSYLKGDQSRGSNVGALMLASAMSVLPLLAAFLCASRFFMSGLTAGAIKE